MNDVFESGKIDDTVKKHGHLISLVSVLISVSVVLSAVYTTKYIIEANEKSIAKALAVAEEALAKANQVRLSEIQENESRSMLNSSSIQSLNYKFRLLENKIESDK